MMKKILLAFLIIFTSFGFVRAQADIEIVGNGTIIVDGQTAISIADDTDFGQTPVGSSVTHQFTINNTGNTTLFMGPVNGTGTSDFSVTNSPDFMIAPLSSSTFDITFNPGVIGIQTVEISVESSDPDESPYTFNIQGEGIVALPPTMEIFGNGIKIINGQTAISITDDTDFGQTPVGSSVTHQFTINNTGNTTLFIGPVNGTGTSDFSVTNSPDFMIAPLSSSTFDITFNPGVIGIQTVEISVESSDPTDSPYTFNIQGEGTSVTQPDIELVGNGTIIVDGQTAISITDDTDFGQTLAGSPVTHTFTVNNTGNSDLFISLPIGINDLGTGTSDFSVVDPFFQVAPSTSETFDITFNPSVVGIQTVEISIISNDPDESPYTFNIQGEGTSSGTNPIIDVSGNGISITNGDGSPDVADNTDFGQILSASSKTNTFTITNDGTAPLTVTSINFLFSSDAEFTINNLSQAIPSDIAPGSFMTFDVVFTPGTVGNYDAYIDIVNSDTSQSPFQFTITGEGTSAVISGNIMITQYYEGTTNSKWIEIKNISGSVITAGTYFLALYENADIPTMATQPPTANESIPAMAIGEVLLFKNAGASLPTVGNLGSASQIVTPVCNFDGNDIILISATNDNTCYVNRQDIIGNSTNWGVGKSFIRGGSDESPQASFDINTWIFLTLGADVDVANPNANIALGTQNIGGTIWTGSWSNLTSDKTRNTEIASTYTAAEGTLTSNNLLVSSNLNLDGGTTNSVVVYGDLNITGTFTIGDTESLVMYGSGSVTGNITKIENSTSRNDEYDFTYWSSPITNANLATVFTGVTASRIFLYDQLQTSVSTAPDYYDNWLVASGAMVAAKGYAAEGPTGTTGVHTISFTGEPNNGEVSIELRRHSDADIENDYNLIGNPYPSAVSFAAFFSGNTNLDATAYLWTHSTAAGGGGDFVDSDYATYTPGSGGSGGGGGPAPTNSLGSSQGFFVRAFGSGVATFNNDMRLVDLNSQFYKSDNSKNKTEVTQAIDRVWLNINSNQGGVNQLLVAFAEKATTDVDNGYDALTYKNSDNPLSFYSIIDNNKYVIQGLPTFNESQTVSLGFDTKVAPRTLTISIDKMEGALKTSEIYLVDNLLNITHDLKTSDYQFEQTTTGEFKNRFILQFANGALDVGDIILGSNDFIVSNTFESLKISANKSVKTIKVYDLLGRMLINEMPNKQSFELNTTNIKIGTVLLIEAVLENGATVNKKTIKY